MLRVTQMARKSRVQQLAEFPFNKIRPASFRLAVASASPRTLARVVVRTDYPSELQQIPTLQIIRRLTHLHCVVCELPARSVAGLAALPGVVTVWDDHFVGWPSADAVRPAVMGHGPPR